VPAGEGAKPRRFDPCTALAAAQFVARLLPGEGGTAGRLAEALIEWAEASEPPDEWIVHGDLYENQILVDGEALGLIDLDDLGPGDPLLDAANFSAHLLLLGASGPPAAAVILGYREELQGAFGRRFDADPAQLAWREAYCLLRLVAGPFRVLHPDWRRRMAHRLMLAQAALSTR
jgi:aminoglycoside phosphotransferase (APT) family kinase protein